MIMAMKEGKNARMIFNYIPQNSEQVRKKRTYSSALAAVVRRLHPVPCMISLVFDLDSGCLGRLERINL